MEQLQETTRIVNNKEDLDKWMEDIMKEKKEKKVIYEQEMRNEMKHRTGILITGIIYVSVLFISTMYYKVPIATVGDYVVYQHLISAVLNICILTHYNDNIREKLKDSFIVLFLLGPSSLYTSIYLLYLLVKRGLKNVKNNRYTNKKFR